MADAYKVLADTSIPRPIRKLEELFDGTPVFEYEGRAYNAGEYVLAKDVSPYVQQQVEDGALDNLLRPVSLEEAEAGIAASGDFGVFVAEHEAEREALVSGGHTVVMELSDAPGGVAATHTAQTAEIRAMQAPPVEEKTTKAPAKASAKKDEEK